MTPGEVFTGLAYATGAGVFYLAARRERLATNGMAMLAGIGFIAGILGAKVTQLVSQGWPIRVPWTAMFQPELGGRALFGGLVVGWIAVEVAKRRMGIRRSTGDLFALALPAGEAIGRIGCHLNGCCYGSEWDGPWSVVQHGCARHPAQLYSGVTALATFGFLLWLRRRGGLPEGRLFTIYLLIFGISRFFLEFVRWRESTHGGLSTMQWVCLDLVGLAVFQLWRARKRPVEVAA